MADVSGDPVVGVDVGDVYACRSVSRKEGFDGALEDDRVCEAECIGVCCFEEIEEEEYIIVNEA